LEYEIVKSRVTIRYVSGRQDQFEVELLGEYTAEGRLKEFAKNPTIVLQTEKDVVIIPATAIESISMPIPDSPSGKVHLPNVRKAKRVK
jgi:hypothetical protein